MKLEEAVDMGLCYINNLKIIKGIEDKHIKDEFISYMKSIDYDWIYFSKYLKYDLVINDSKYEIVFKDLTDKPFRYFGFTVNQLLSFNLDDVLMLSKEVNKMDS